MCQCGQNWSLVTCPPCSSLCKFWTMRWRWTFTWIQDHTTIPNPTLHLLAGAKSPSMFEVGFSLGCEVMFMKVCAEGRKTASTDWMPPSLFTLPLRDVPPLTPEWDPWQRCQTFCHFSCTIHTTADFIQVTSVGPIRRYLTLILIVFNLLHIIDLCE